VTLNATPKLLILSNSLSGGGAEISMMRLFQTLKKQGVKVALCAINKDSIASSYEDGITLLGREWSSGPLQSLKSLVSFGKYLRKNRNGILILNCELPELYAALMAPWSMKIIAVEHTSRPWSGRRVLGFLVRFNLAMRNTRWVTVSRDQDQVWPFKTKASFIPNAISPISRESKTNLGTSMTSTAELVFVGRLNEGKQPLMAAEVNKMAGTSIDFFGDGPLLGELRELYESPKCRFHGFVSNPWAIIGKNAILVVTSEFEGDGMNIVEGAINGNPILLADNIDLRRFDFPKNLYFRDQDDLLRKILEAQDTNLDTFRIDDRTKNRLLNERNPSRVAEQWLKLLEDKET
jgi:glycosyltransferase involved in cell wall biosynthesis